MFGRTHLLFGLVLGFLLMKIFSLPSLAVVFVALGSLFPDLDHSSSLIASFNFVFKDTSKVISKVVGHRTYLHTLEAGFLSAALLAFVLNYYGLEWIVFSSLFFAGFVGHLFLDSLTRSGVPLTFSGVNKHKKYGLRFMRTGSVEEKWLFVVLVVVFAGFFL